MLPGENKGLGHQQIAKKHVGRQRLAVEGKKTCLHMNLAFARA